MFEYLSQNPLLVMAGAGFFLFLIYLMFAFANYIPHFLITVYFTIPLFYELTNMEVLPLTSIFVFLLGPIILWRAKQSLFFGLWPLGAYLAIVIIASALNGTFMWENRSAFIPLVISILCIVSLSNRDVERRMQLFSYVIVCWIVVNSIFSILQLTAGEAFYLISATDKEFEFGGVQRGYGLIGMATQVGVTFCLGVPLLGSLLMNGRKNRFLLFMLTIVSCIGLVTAFSRGAIIGVFVALLLVMLFHKKYKMFTTFVAIGAFIVVAYASLIILLPKDFSTFLQGKDGSASARIPYTMIALKMFADKPLTGFGFGGFTEFCTQYGSKIHIEAHNTYAQVLVEYGITGFFFFLVIIGLSVKGYFSYLRSGKSLVLKTQGIGYLSALIAVLIDSLVHCFEWNLIFWLPIMLGYLLQYFKNNELRMAAVGHIHESEAISANTMSLHRKAV